MNFDTKVLLVDDRVENLIALETLLKEFDIDLERALSGNEALQKIIDTEYALILLDVQMPDMDGFETVTLLRQDKRYENTPVIFLSAVYKDEANTIKGIESGAIDFIVKPIIPEILIGKVRNYLSLYRDKKKLKEMNIALKSNEKALIRTTQLYKTLSQLASELISPTLTLEDMSIKVFNAAISISESEHGFVSEIDPETKDNIGHNLSKMMGKSCNLKGSDKKIAFPCGSDGKYPGMWGIVLNSKEPFYTNNYIDDPNKTHLPKGHVPIVNFLAVPVLYNGNVVGEIALANSLSGYTVKDVEAVSRIAMIYALCIMRKRDIEYRQKVEIELVKAENMKLVGQLAGGIAHDFNNQLAVIIGSAEISLEENRGDKKIEERMNNIIDVSSNVADLTRKLLAFAQREKHNQKFFSTQKVIDTAVTKFQSGNLGKAFDFSTELYQDDISLKGDSVQISRAIYNILCNSFDAIEKGGHIVLKTYLHNEYDDIHITNDLTVEIGDYFIIEVIDSGKGISDDIKERIYEPFFSTKVFSEGQGMGLSEVEGIVKMHNGYSSFKKNSPKGTRFYLVLPYYKNIE